MYPNFISNLLNFDVKYVNEYSNLLSIINLIVKYK